MSKGITLSPKYGVNPCIPLCFFCQKPKNEIVMLGRIWQKDANGKKVRGTDLEAPKNLVLDYELCEECMKELVDNDELLALEVSNQIDGMPIALDYVPTGKYTKISAKEFVETQGEEIPPKRICLVPKE